VREESIMSWELLDSAHLSPLEMVSMIELVLYRTRAQMEEEKEELAIADDLTSV
jgi:hypothetical protein